MTLHGKNSGQGLYLIRDSIRRFVQFMITVKLSDNIAKATGRPENIERFKKVFGYTSKYEERCRY